VEEYRVSVFAQELGTAEPVSKVKLDRALADLTRSRSAAGFGGTNEINAVRRTEPTPFRPLVTTLEKKVAPLKNLSALDRLFPR
jgi:ATP-dependent helicase HrpA